MLFLGAVEAPLCSGAEPHSCSNEKIIRVEDGQFIRDGKPYYFVGTNFWYGAILGSTGEGGNRERLTRELDFMKEQGIENLRILIGGEGENGLLGKIEPNLQPLPGEYNDDILAGLDYLMMELGRRDMTAVLYFNNAWEWSGGYTQYVAWANDTPVLVPRVDGWFSYNTRLLYLLLAEIPRLIQTVDIRRVEMRVLLQLCLQMQ